MISKKIYLYSIYWWLAIKNFVAQFVYFDNDPSLFHKEELKNSRKQLIEFGDYIFINSDWSLFIQKLQISRVKNADKLVLLDLYSIEVMPDDTGLSKYAFATMACEEI